MRFGSDSVTTAVGQVYEKQVLGLLLPEMKAEGAAELHSHVTRYGTVRHGRGLVGIDREVGGGVGYRCILHVRLDGSSGTDLPGPRSRARRRNWSNPGLGQLDRTPVPTPGGLNHPLPTF